MKKVLLALLMAVGLTAGPAIAANPPPSPPSYSVLSGSVPLAVTSTSARVALPSTAPSATAVTLYNGGSKDAYFEHGSSSVVATTASKIIRAGTYITFYSGDPDVAAITAGSDTTTLTIYQGTGPLQFGMVGGSGGGSGGTVTEVDTAGGITGGPITTTGTVSLASIAANTVLGSVAGGVPAALTKTQLTALINPTTASLPGTLPAFPNNTTTFFRGDGTYATLNCAALTNAGTACPANLGTSGATVPQNNTANTFSAMQAINLNAAPAPTPITGTVLQVTGADSAAGFIENDTFGATPIFTGRRADGTGASPSGVLSGEALAGFSARPYDGSAYATGSTGNVQAVANENFSSSHHGTDIVMNCDAPTTVTVAECARAKSSGFTIPAGSTYQINGTQIAAANLSNGVTGSGAVVLGVSPALTGAPTAPTATLSDNSTTLATTAFIKGQSYVTGGPYLPLAGGTMTGGLINSTNGAASTPSINITGTPFAGTGTTSYPLVYINTAGSTQPTSLNTSGTMFGINAPSGFGGNMIDGHVNGGGTTFSINTFGQMVLNSGVQAGSSGAFSWNGRGILTSSAAGNFQLGNTDAASPVAQTLSVQSVVAGTSNTAGSNGTFAGSKGTGTGIGGSLLFQTAPAGLTGTTQNALVTAMTIDSNGQALHSINPTASTSALALTGTVYASGTGTTTFPMLRIEPSGATAATTWSTGGTLLGFNTPSGFGGLVIDIHANGGGSNFSMNSSGSVTGAGNFTAGAFRITNGSSVAAWTTTGTAFQQRAVTWTDTSTATGTLAAEYISAFKAPTLAFSNTSVVVTDPYNVYVENPVAGTNASFTDGPWALGADSEQITGASGLSLTSATTNGIGVFNTADQKTNFEDFRFNWQSNVATLATEKGGTGTLRDLQFFPSGARSQVRMYQTPPSNAGLFDINGGNDNGVGGSAVRIAQATMSASSGTQYLLNILGVINQTSTAGYTGLLVNPTETATGSGTKILADFQVGSASKAKIDNKGSITEASLVAGGAAPTLTGTCTSGTQTGGNTAGTFLATCVAQTMIITFATTAPNGWACNAHDLTTPADALNQTASGATSCTLTGTTVANDNVSFNAIAF